MLHINDIKEEIIEIVSREDLAGGDIRDGNVTLIDPFFIKYKDPSLTDRFSIAYGYNRFGLCCIKECDCQSQESNFIFPSKENIKNISYFNWDISSDDMKKYEHEYGFSRDETDIYIDKSIDIDNIFNKVRTINEKIKREEEEYKKNAPSKLKSLCEAVLKGEMEITSVKNEIENLCSLIFITNDGKPDANAIFDFIKQVKEVDIYAGEYDDFGWLTGVFDLNGHKIIFG